MITAGTSAINIPKVVPITTMTGARAGVKAIKALREGDWGVNALQDFRERRILEQDGSVWRCDVAALRALVEE